VRQPSSQQSLRRRQLQIAPPVLARPAVMRQPGSRLTGVRQSSSSIHLLPLV